MAKIKLLSAGLNRGYLLIALVFGVTLACVVPVFGKDNTVVRYLGNAELQLETADQNRELQKALSDILTKSPGALRKQRYFEYQHKRKVWDIVTIIEKHYLPEPLTFIDRKTFYSDVRSPNAKAVVKKQLAKLKAAASNDTIPTTK